MKKVVLLCFCLCGIMFCSVGCVNDLSAEKVSLSSDSNNQTETASKQKHNVVRYVSSEAELADYAKSLDELIKSSELIVEAKVVATKSFVEKDSVIISTSMTPEIINIYKGEYNGEPLVVGGGYMKCKDYAEIDKFKDQELPNPLDKSTFTDKELEGEIYFNWMNNYTPEPGDRIIYFGSKSPLDGSYHVKNCYQGLFVCHGDTVENQAIEVGDNDGYVEPFAENIQKHIKNTKIRNIKNDLVTKNKSLIIPKDVFVEKLKITKNADMNSDGEVNGLDTSILIEKQLGK